jgi:type VI secretion system protein ImpA
MPLREDILTPIPGDSPGGKDLRYAPIYDKIKEARREDDELAQGAWQYERKVADYPQVIRLAQDAIAKESKDLQLAAWLAEALLRKNGFEGLCEGLTLCRDLVVTFWDHLFPELEDGDAEFRAAPLEWIGTKFEIPVKNVPLTREGYDFLQYKESRSVGYEDQAKEKDRKAARDAALKAGKLAPEIFDKAFGETPKAFYAQAEKNIDGSMEALAALDQSCHEKFGDDAAPAFGKLKSALEEVRHAVHGFLQKKREIEPDPVEEKPPEPAAEAPAAAEGGEPASGPVSLATQPAAMTTVVLQAPEDPPDRREAIGNLVAFAAFLRKREPRSPAPYLMLRGLRWGELRAALQVNDLTKLEAPPTDVRRLIKKLALDTKWRDLIEAAENVMGLPCSRAWLDLQRLVVEACVALGADYQLIAMAIQSELRALVRDVPEILTLTLMDDTPAANLDTQAWLRQLAEEPQSATPKPLPLEPLMLNGEAPAGWQHQFVDAFQLAIQAVRSGQEQKAFEILQADLQRQRTGRGRFERRLQLVQLCVSTGKEAIMQPFLEDLMTAIENHKLDEWEDREKLAAALATILKASKKIQGDAKEKQKLFDRICRLDAVQALSVG